MTEENNTYSTDYRVITIKTSDGSTVRGKVNVSPKQRVSEIFTANMGPFVVVVEASYGHVTDKTLFINKEHIVWVEPED